MKIVETGPREIGFVLGGHCQNLLDDPRILNSFPASGDYCCLLITFAKSLDPDQTRQNVRPDLDPNCLDTDCIKLMPQQE